MEKSIRRRNGTRVHWSCYIDYTHCTEILMYSLDLHGKSHEDVDRIVENFILLSEVPSKIITGNSDIMKELVINVVERHGFDWKYDIPNYGCIVVIESTKQQVKRIELELYKGEG